MAWHDYLCRLPLICLATFFAPPLVQGESPEKAVAANHRWDDDSATIRVRGLKNSIVVLHLSDSHISVRDKKEESYWQYSARMDDAYGSQSRHFRTGQKALPVDHFRQLLETAKARHVDLVALTGDIVNNPSRSSVQAVGQLLQEAGLRFLYVAGNHDWHYEGMSGSQDSLRDTWARRSLLPLYAGRNPLCYAVQLEGLNFVAIDDSTYQVNEAQLAFYEREVARGLPTILLLHIPLWIGEAAEKHVSHCGDPRWGWDTDLIYQIERRQRWSKAGNLKFTTDFVERVKTTPNLIAVLAGHTHRARADRLSASAVQYVAQAACDGGSRLVTFEPEELGVGR